MEKPEPVVSTCVLSSLAPDAILTSDIIPPLGLGEVKGQARLHTFLMVLSLIYEDCPSLDMQKDPS